MVIRLRRCATENARLSHVPSLCLEPAIIPRRVRPFNILSGDNTSVDKSAYFTPEQHDFYSPQGYWCRACYGGDRCNGVNAEKSGSLERVPVIRI
jgi:hypothetical protein